MFVFVDVETTGLVTHGPDPDMMLELGIVITNDDLILQKFQSWVIAPAHPKEMEPVVKEMHDKSGLWVACHTAQAVGFAHAEMEAISFLQSNKATGKPMCGSSLRLDRNMIDLWMPGLATKFHYRSIDVSTIKELVKIRFPEIAWPPMDDKNKVHRVIEDCVASITELKWYMNHLTVEGR